MIFKIHSIRLEENVFERIYFIFCFMFSDTIEEYLCFFCGMELSSSKTLSKHVKTHWTNQSKLPALLRGNVNLWEALELVFNGVSFPLCDGTEAGKSSFANNCISFFFNNCKKRLWLT